MKDAELVSIIGARGRGKSTLARELSAAARRSVIVDPSGDWKRNGVKDAKSLSDLSRKMAAHWKRGFRFVYCPPPDEEAEALHRISNLVLAYQQRYARGEQITLVVDEMAECYGQAHAMTRGLSGFRRVCLQGRHYGVNVIGITQRPADIAPRFRDNAARTFVFALYDHTSRNAVLARIGRQHVSLLAGLERLEYLACEAGRVEKRKLTNSRARRR